VISPGPMLEGRELRLYFEYQTRRIPSSASPTRFQVRVECRWVRLRSQIKWGQGITFVSGRNLCAVVGQLLVEELPEDIEELVLCRPHPHSNIVELTVELSDLSPRDIPPDAYDVMLYAPEVCVGTVDVRLQLSLLKLALGPDDASHFGFGPFMGVCQELEKAVVSLRKLASFVTLMGGRIMRRFRYTSVCWKLASAQAKRNATH
jgi:hypothetical protein